MGKIEEWERRRLDYGHVDGTVRTARNRDASPEPPPYDPYAGERLRLGLTDGVVRTGLNRQSQPEPPPYDPYAGERLRLGLTDDVVRAAKQPSQAQREAEELAKTRELMKLREGDKDYVYRDSMLKPTVGIGHRVQPADHLNLGDKISDARKEAFFEQDISKALNAARQQAAEAGITDPEFIPYLTSINYQLGVGWRKDFKDTWKLIMDGQYARAAEEAANSRWAHQTPTRLHDFQDALRRLPPKRD